MDAHWIAVIIAGLGFAGQWLWTTVNLRIENRMLEKIDELKSWADDRFEPKRPENSLRIYKAKPLQP